MGGELAQFIPEVVDNIDGDRTMKSIWTINNADPTTLLDKKEVDAKRQVRAEQQAQEQQQIAMAQGMQNLKTASEATKNMTPQEGANG